MVHIYNLPAISVLSSQYDFPTFFHQHRLERGILQKYQDCPTSEVASKAGLPHTAGRPRGRIAPHDRTPQIKDCPHGRTPQRQDCPTRQDAPKAGLLHTTGRPKWQNCPTGQDAPNNGRVVSNDTIALN